MTDDGGQTEEESCLMAAGEEDESIKFAGKRKAVWRCMDFPELRLIEHWFPQTGQVKHTVKLAQIEVDEHKTENTCVF